MTIAKVTRPFVPHELGNERRQSAITAIEALLDINIMDAHKKRLIDRCIWYYTEADGKYNLRYRSEAALLVPNVRGQVQHEHVFERKELIQRLLVDGESVVSVCKDAVACLVTPEEHRQLGRVKDQSGWNRYQSAEIKVYDMSQDTYLALEMSRSG